MICCSMLTSNQVETSVVNGFCQTDMDKIFPIGNRLYSFNVSNEFRDDVDTMSNQPLFKQNEIEDCPYFHPNTKV